MLKKSKVIITLVLASILSLSLAAGCTITTNNPLSSNPLSSDSDIGIVEEAWDIITDSYVERDDLDKQALRQAAIEGMLEELDDPYTAYLDTEAYHMSIASLEGKFSGIGAYVGTREEQLTIIAPIVGSPAEQAGIRAGDIVLEIDGLPTSGMSQMEAILKIRGPEGTSVKLLVLHPDEAEPVELEIVRAEIEIPSVSFEMKGDIAYLSIHYFSERTGEETVEALKSINQQNPTALILDLRQNPGGLLDIVVDVASQFLKEGVVVYVVDNQGEKKSSLVEPGGLATELPMVVLTDNFSASGSEVLAGALQDHKRAVIAGAQTYGKGSVNTLRPLRDGSALYITIARWLTPDGYLIEGKGITPDYELDVEGEAAIQWAIDYLEGNIPASGP